MNEPQRREMINLRFRERFGAAPKHWVRAPGSLELMGSHTDTDLRHVLAVSISRDTWIAASPREDRVVCVHSINLGANATFSLDSLGKNPRQPWSNYLRGVASVLEAQGLSCVGFNGLIHSTVPISSGLGSSAAFQCAAATLFEAMAGWKIEPVRKALLCQRAEHEFVGVDSGVSDPFTSCLGQEGCALLLDSRDLTSRPVQLPAELSLVVCETKVEPGAAASEYAKRRAQCEGARRLGISTLREISVSELKARINELPGEIARRCTFIVEENARVLALATALADSNRIAIRQLMADSYRGACELYEIVSPPMQKMMNAVLNAPGMVGARQTGTGSGGCMVALVERVAVQDFTSSVDAAYLRATRVKPEIYPVEAAAGTSLLNSPPEKAPPRCSV